MPIRSAVTLFILLGSLFADIVPVPGTQRVGPIFERADLVCNCEVESLRKVSEETLGTGVKLVIRRHLVAKVRVVEAYNTQMAGGTHIYVAFDQDVPTTSGAMPALSESERAVLFLQRSEFPQFGFADPFLGATPFSLIPVQGKGSGLPRLEAALTAVVGGRNRDDKINALQLLRGFDQLGADTLTALTALTASSDPEVAISAIAVLLRTKSPESVDRLKDYLRAYSGGTPPEALVSVGSELGEVRDEKALPVLRELSASNLVSVRTGSMQALRAIGSPKAIPTVVKRLDDSDVYVRYLAVMTLAETLGKYGDYAPNMDLFDRNPEFYVGLWKSWWETEGQAYQPAETK